MRRAAIGKSPWKYATVAGAGFTIGAENTNAITVNVQLKDQDGSDLAVRGSVGWYLSSDANGDALAIAANGGVAAGTDGVVKAITTGQDGWATSEADGDIDFVITDSTARTVYLNLRMPDGSIVTSGAIAFT